MNIKFPKQLHLAISILALWLSLAGFGTSFAQNVVDTNAPGYQPAFKPEEHDANYSSFYVRDYLVAPGQEKSLEATLKNAADQGPPIANFIIRAINFLTLTIGSVSLLLMIVGGVILVTSRGSENGTAKGKETIKYAIFGLIITLSAYYIVAFVQNLLFVQ